MFAPNILEEELKNRIATEYFGTFSCDRIIGNIDFCVAPRLKRSDFEALGDDSPSYLWAEAKSGRKDTAEALVQLLLTIGKARTFDNYEPPRFVGAFNTEQILFIPYEDVQEVFYKNDFNWNVAPSDHKSREFGELAELVDSSIRKEALRYRWDEDREELKSFIRDNFTLEGGDPLVRPVDHRNYIRVYQKWVAHVKQTIDADWQVLARVGISDADFFLADLINLDNQACLEKLQVVLEKTKFDVRTGILRRGKRLVDTDISFSRDAHDQFWKRYKRPPTEAEQQYIIDRRDLLVPQEVREHKGAFYTPPQWVALSQKYLADTLGANWQEECYIWDCAAGTGNLLAGLKDKYRIFASTLDWVDVDIMHQNIRNGANLLREHVFQFDFLNDPIEKAPEALQRILQDPEKRKKLVIYINPPYAEATSMRTVAGTGANRPGVSSSHPIKREANPHIGSASNELFALFLYRIQRDFDGCTIGNFSTLKLLQASSFKKFRDHFRAELKSLFIVPSHTFDNVSGKFPIGFHIWQTMSTPLGSKVQAKSDIYVLQNGIPDLIGEKRISTVTRDTTINRWYMNLVGDYGSLPPEDAIASIGIYAPDNQHYTAIHIANRPGTHHVTYVPIGAGNLVPTAVYLAVRLALPPNWLTRSDQFLAPSGGWMADATFHADCLAYILLSGKNLITSRGQNINHWIPFPEAEVEPHEAYASRWMVEFIAGRLESSKHNVDGIMGNGIRPWATGQTLIVFSPEAQSVMEAGRALFRYYHQQRDANPNASFYDIRAHFQGFKTSPSGKQTMNPKSSDARYMDLLEALRDARVRLAEKIAPKIYHYGFLLSDHLEG